MQANISALLSDVVTDILEFCDRRTFVQASYVNKLWNQLSNEQRFWSANFIEQENSRMIREFRNYCYNRFRYENSSAELEIEEPPQNVAGEEARRYLNHVQATFQKRKKIIKKKIVLVNCWKGWCNPFMTIGCNAVLGDFAILGCPYVSFCGSEAGEPGKECYCCPIVCKCRDEEETVTQRCILGFPFSMLCCCMCYVPAYLMSWICPSLCKVGPISWCCNLDDFGGRGYNRSDWYDE
jgi:hypothetical protein